MSITLKELHERLLKLEARHIYRANKRRLAQRRKKTPAPKRVTSTVQTIKSVVANYYGMDILLLDADLRPEWVTWPRHVAMFLAGQLCPEASLGDIGVCFGGRDHGTVFYGKKRVADRIATEPRMADEVAEVLTRCQTALTPVAVAA